MKKSIYIISILAAGLLLMVYSCSKEEVQTAKSHENDLTPYEIQVHNAIKGFINTIEMHRDNPHYKSGQVVSPDSALWLLEATINYSHAFPNEFYTAHEIEDLTLVIPKTADGMIDMADLTQKYDEMKSDITTVYYGSSFDNKGLVLVDLEEDSQTETELNLRVQVVTGDGGSDSDPGTPGINGPFGVGDEWWYGETLGGCNPHTGETDAAEQLFIAMNSYIASQNVNVGFPTITSITIMGGDQIAYNRLFDKYHYQGIPFHEYNELCMDSQDMNNYWQMMRYLIYTKLQVENVIPSDYKLVELTEFVGSHEPVEGGIHYYHRYVFKFGDPIYRAPEAAVEL
ncbi:MAG: hypothetical protein ACNA7V_12935 [Bacteroidales bacterium]